MAADIIQHTLQEIMALMSLILDGFYSLSSQLRSYLQTSICSFVNTSADSFLPITFKLDIRIYHRIQWNILHLVDYLKT